MTPRKRLEKKADELWSLCVRTRDRVCRNCNSEDRLQAHHLAGRVYKRTRLLLENGVCLCSRCHFPEKVRPEEFREMVISIVGERHYKLMHEMARDNGKPYKRTMEELKVEVQHLTNKLTSLRADWGKI